MTQRSAIWLVTVGEPLPIDPDSRALRTRLLAQELTRRGHDVVWWTSRFDHFSKRHFAVDEEIVPVEGYRLAFLDGTAYRRNVSIARQKNHWQIARDFERKAMDHPAPAAIVCSFPPIELAGAVARYAQKHRVPMVADVRDLWPDEMRVRVPGFFRPIAEPVFKAMERSVACSLSAATSLVGVSQRYLDWAAERVGRPLGTQDHVTPLGYPDHPASAAMRSARAAEDTAAPATFFFSGSFNNSVDLPGFVRAFRSIDDPAIRAIICGDGEHAADWRALAEGDNRIRFTGWVNATEIRAQALLANVGLVCYKPGSHVAMPNKLFEYMSFGLPVLNSIGGEASELVARSEIGWNYPAGKEGELALILRRVIDNGADRKAMSLNSGRLFESLFSSEVVYRAYADRVEHLLATI